jgi:retinol dehydrogenase-16
MGACLEFWNNLCHIDLLEEWIWYNYFADAWLLGPILALLIICYDLLSGFFIPVFHVEPSRDKVIFITGCDSGFGKALAVRLDQKGFKVYAACLTAKGADEITAECAAVQTLLLDVTKADQVQSAADRVDSENPQGLYALVNNAGVAKSGLIDWFGMSDFRFCMEVNFFGVISVTKAFLPLVKRSKGRIVVVSSIAGVSCGYPLSAPYSASKQAVELFTSSLRQELRPWGIKVSTINPGFHRTEMNKVAVQGLEACFDKVPLTIQAQYGPAYFEGCKEFVKTHTEDVAFDSINVVRALEHAVTGTRPRVQYRVGLDAKYGLVWTQILPLRVGEKIIYALTTSKKMRTIVGLKPVGEAAQAKAP